MSANLFVISGPSGVGKDTLMALILDKIPSLKRWITCTTRNPRPGEVDGKDYFFKSPSEFKYMIDNNELVEYNEFAENFYGTPKKFAYDNLKSGQSLITAIDVNGAKNVKKEFNQSTLIFIEPPSLEELKNRLLNRGTESPEYIEKRLAIVSSELSEKHLFDVSFINDNLESTLQELINFISSK